MHCRREDGGFATTMGKTYCYFALYDISVLPASQLPIGQDHIGNGSVIRILAECLKRTFFP